MKIHPLHDRVVISPVTEEKTIGGILLPDTAGEKPIRGEVVAVGPGKTLENGQTAKMSVKPGDKVLYGKYAGTEVEFGGKKLVVMREDDIMGIIG